MITITGKVNITRAQLAKCFKDAVKKFDAKPIKGFKIDEAFLKEFGDDIINNSLAIGITDFFIEGIDNDVYADFIVQND